LINQTSLQFDAAIATCRQLFLAKNKDYGTSWRIMRLTTITDQLYIKAQRIRNIEENGVQQIGDDVQSEYIGIVNYCVMGLIQIAYKDIAELDLPIDKLTELYDQLIADTKALMMKKNHDYGEVWREMRVSSFTDILLVRLLRIKQIEDNKGNTLISEGIDANLQDMINYAVFALIRLSETTKN
jgi:hypothetical protein